MTRGELEKEAEEYAIGLFPNDVFRQSAVIQGIIKFTEPREKRIAELEKENNKLLDVINNQDVKIADLEKENAELKQRLVFARAEFQRQYKENEELRNNGFTVSAMTEQQLKAAIEKGEQLEKDFRICEKNADTYYDQLTKAKEIIKKFSEFANNEIEYDPEHPQEHTDLWNKLCEQAKQFLKEIEK